MNIEELNELNKTHMIAEMKSDLEFEWYDKEIMDIIMKQFGEIYLYSSDPKEFVNNRKYINRINEYIRSFNKKEIFENLFLNKMEQILKEVLEEFSELKYRYEYNIDHYKKDVEMANRLLIDGDGGIGKSCFLFKLEENLSKSLIPHLCIYCKYTKIIPEEVIESIYKTDEEFYLIIDAFNELEKEEQQSIITIIEKLLPIKNVNIIISYRTNNLEETARKKLENLLKNTYTFRGVKYESSLIKIIEAYGVEVTKFMDILETNNPLYLKMLHQILNKSKIKKEEIGNLVQITYILEKYIKLICGKDCWEHTKEIGEYMFDHDIKSIDENEIKSILNLNTETYINTMMNHNLIDFFVYNGKKKYIFKIQYLSDFIIARTLNKKITRLDDEKIIKLVNKKIDKMDSLKEAILILIMDRYKNREIEKALKIIFNSNLKDSFQLSTLRKIYLSNGQIKKIQKNLNVVEINDAFFELGGYCNRPFNCSNYITERFIENKVYINSDMVKFYESTCLLKLKNILYSIIFIDEDNEYIKEAFWYSFWLTSVPNNRIRNLAMKVLFDIVDKFEKYAITLKECYHNVEEFYIRKSIIRVLTSLSNLDKEIIIFLNEVLQEYNQIDSEIVYRISNYLRKGTNYILLDKENIYKSINENDGVDKELNFKKILFTADMHEKFLLKFERYNCDDKLSLYNNFILNNKQEILNWNTELINKFSCVYDDGYCKYSTCEEMFKKSMKKIKIIEIDESTMFIAFQKVFIKICNFYNYSYSRDKEKFYQQFNEFEDSVLKKILLISQDILLGSLMCNYYTKEFSVFNDNRTFGYKIYEPFEFDEEEIRIYSPVSIYCENIDKLNNKICSKIDLYGIRNQKWFDDANLSIENCKKMCHSIEFQGEEWSLICADIHRYVSDSNGKHIYTETYDFNIVIDSKENLIGDSNSCKLTIDKEEYIGNIKEYNQKKYTKSTKLRNIESYSKDFKDTHLSLPPTILISELDLHYNRKDSTWRNSEGNIIMYCDNNSKDYYRNSITGAIYIKTEHLNKIFRKHDVKYWAYTEKNYMNKGWNDEASLHIELDKNGNVNKMFNNNKLVPNKEEVNKNCKKCKYNIYQEMNDKNIEYMSKLELLKNLRGEEY